MDLNNMQTWHYGAIIGGGLLIIGLIIYFLPAGKLKIPGGVTAAFGGLALGLAAGIIWMAGFGYQAHGPGTGATDDAPADTKNAAPGPGGAGGGFGKGGGGNQKGGNQKGGGFGGGGGAPNPRVQLVGLVNALDAVADRPVVLNLSPESRAAIAEQLKGLDTADLKDEDAKAKLDAIQKVVEKDRKALEAVGYRWVLPDGKTAQPPKAPFPKDGNPFADGQAKDHLKSLRERLEKK
ncbi:MAG TPA: hypothetical protein VHR66_23360 [Gemmataceae bacterium]|jgi:hypothetical protein|nr:hypothetical protein [Gemmataceae bacterium]